jgi:hypothetical protein
MQKLDSSAIEMVQVRMQSTFDLKRLYDIYDDGSNTNPFLSIFKGRACIKQTNLSILSELQQALS